MFFSSTRSTLRLLVLCSPIALLPGCGVTQVVDRRGDQVILVRSPQPDRADLEELCQEHGLRTVLNLRAEEPGRSWYEEEREAVAALGLRWVHLPISEDEAPREEEVRTFFALLSEESHWPVLMHCQGGIHRTGVLVALYRVEFQGWSADRAIAEMEDRHFDFGVQDRSAMKAFVRRHADRRRGD